MAQLFLMNVFFALKGSKLFIIIPSQLLEKEDWVSIITTLAMPRYICHECRRRMERATAMKYLCGHDVCPFYARQLMDVANIGQVNAIFFRKSIVIKQSAFRICEKQRCRMVSVCICSSGLALFQRKQNFFPDMDSAPDLLIH